MCETPFCSGSYSLATIILWPLESETLLNRLLLTVLEPRFYSDVTEHEDGFMSLRFEGFW